MEEDVSTLQKIKRWFINWLIGEWRRFVQWVREVELGVAWGLSGVSLVAFIFTSIWYIDPALLTMIMQFQPATCNTHFSAELIGLKNCTWTSCRIGCTAELFHCWHVLVNYTLVSGSSPISPPWGSLSTLSSSSTPNTNEEPIAKLFPNVKGCGYPPRLNCHEFFSTYGLSNTSYPCWVSHLDPKFALTQIDFKRLKEEVTYSLIPLGTFIVFTLYALCRLGVFSLCNPLRCCPSPPTSMEKIRLTPSQLHRYKRALHAKRRELEKKRAELSGDDEQAEIEEHSEDKPNNNIIEEINTSDSDNIETIDKSSKDKKLSWDFGNIENLPGCSTALQHLETLPAKSVKKKD